MSNIQDTTNTITYSIYELDTGIIIETEMRPSNEMHGIRIPEGCGIIYQEANPETDLINTKTLSVEKNTRTYPPEIITYSEARKIAYPSIGDQLDMLWHAMDSDTMQKIEPFYGIIKTIKERFPEGTSVEKNSIVTYRL